MKLKLTEQLAPAEELLFRGFIQGKLQKWMNPYFSYWYSIRSIWVNAWNSCIYRWLACCSLYDLRIDGTFWGDTFRGCLLQNRQQHRSSVGCPCNRGFAFDVINLWSLVKV